MTDYDIAIVGGGIVGASLARALAGSNYRIALLESRRAPTSTDPAANARTLALSFSSRRIFDALQVWPALNAHATPIRSVHVSERGRFGAVRLHHDEYGVDALGYIVPNVAIEAALYADMATCANVTMISGAELRQVQVGERAVTATFATCGATGDTIGDDANCLSARLLVAADGAASPLRELLNVETLRDDYEQTAIVAVVTLDREHNFAAYERFTPHGPLALLPMDGRRCSLVWTHSHVAAEARLGQSDSEFLAGLQDEFGHRLGRFVHTGKRHAFPLALVRARRTTQQRIVLIGNSAHTLHPVAGQGFNLALRNIAVLSELLTALDAGDDPGNADLLAAYCERTRDEIERVIGFTDALARVFTNPLVLLGPARAAGLLATDLCAPLRNRVARQSMGLRGRLPRLACGLPLMSNQRQ